jgi:DNA-3-methyladenine glycosylase
MFGPPGSLYVYLVYGMYWMLNVVTGPIGYPAAVLIRGVERIGGPGRLTKAFGITGMLNGCEATRKTGIWFEQSDKTELPQVIRSARVGVDYAGPTWSKKEFRFSVAKG